MELLCSFGYFRYNISYAFFNFGSLLKEWEIFWGQLLFINNR